MRWHCHTVTMHSPEVAKLPNLSNATPADICKSKQDPEHKRGCSVHACCAVDDDAIAAGGGGPQQNLCRRVKSHRCNSPSRRSMRLQRRGERAMDIDRGKR